MTTPLLTLVTDRRRATMSVPQLAEQAVEGGVDLVQIRERDLSDADLHRLVADVVAAVGRHRVAVNDAPGIAGDLGVHLHLPERSMAGFEPSSGIPSLSCSVHGAGALDRVPLEASYVILGHLFPTATHPSSPPLPPAEAETIVARSERPVVLIGGITRENLAPAMTTGAAGIAVMSYVNSSSEPRRAARELRDELERAMSQQLASVSIQVNGRPMVVDPGSTLTAFLEGRNLHPRLVVVERNREIVPKSAYDSTVLQEGDLLEIAHFVGGG